MPPLTRSLLAVAFILAATTLSYAADKIDNPSYKAWSKFKPGTTVTARIDSDMNGNKSVTEMTTTLLELNAEKAVIETRVASITEGAKTEQPVQKTEELAKIDKPPEAPAPNPKPEVKESTDTVEVLGKPYTCKLTETKSQVYGIIMVTKSWTTDDIPGRQAKLESTSSGAVTGSSKITITALTIK